MRPKTFLNVAAIGLIGFLVVAGTLAGDLNYTAIALALVAFVTALNDPLGRRKDDDK